MTSRTDFESSIHVVRYGSWYIHLSTNPDEPGYRYWKNNGPSLFYEMAPTVEAAKAAIDFKVAQRFQGEFVHKVSGDTVVEGYCLVVFKKISGVICCNIEDERGLIHTNNTKRLEIITDEAVIKGFHIRRSHYAKRITSARKINRIERGLALRKAGDHSYDEGA